MKNQMVLFVVGILAVMGLLAGCDLNVVSGGVPVYEVVSPIVEYVPVYDTIIYDTYDFPVYTDVVVYEEWKARK